MRRVPLGVLCLHVFVCVIGIVKAGVLFMGFSLGMLGDSDPIEPEHDVSGSKVIGPLIGPCEVQTLCRMQTSVGRDQIYCNQPE